MQRTRTTMSHAYTCLHFGVIFLPLFRRFPLVSAAADLLVGVCWFATFLRLYCGMHATRFLSVSLCNSTYISLCIGFMQTVACCVALSAWNRFGQLIVNTLLAAWSNTTTHTLFIEWKEKKSVYEILMLFSFCAACVVVQTEMLILRRVDKGYGFRLVPSI